MLEEWNILTPLNHDFRRGYLCATQLLAATDDLMTSFDRGEQVDVLALDFSKAFDTVPHNKLLHKFKEYEIKGNILLDWLKDFLCNREMTVVVDVESSTSIQVESGVPQGTVLGSILFYAI
jgi:ribonuclease P/MRP protein subunit RPP40